MNWLALIGQDISKIVQGDSYNNWKLNLEELRAIVGIEVDNEPLDLDEINLLPSNLQRAIKRFIGLAPVTLSKLISNGERNHLGEKSGLPPNFVHSHDACHMRLVVNDMKNRGVGDIWSVHDSFGCHPNHLEILRTSVIDNMKITHQDKGSAKGMLDELLRTTSGIERSSFRTKSNRNFSRRKSRTSINSVKRWQIKTSKYKRKSTRYNY